MRNVKSLNLKKDNATSVEGKTLQNIVVFNAATGEYVKVAVHIVLCARCESPIVNNDKSNTDSNENMSLCSECLLAFV